jgi:hypothetical protein
MYFIVYPKGMSLLAFVALTVHIVVEGSTAFVTRTSILLATAKYIRHAHIQDAVGIPESTFDVMFPTVVALAPSYFTCLIAQF